MSSFLNFLRIKVPNKIPNKFLGKIGVSEVISVVLVVLMGIALAGTAYMWGIPMITKRQDTTKVERVYTYFEQSNSNSLVRKIEFIAKNGGEDTFTPDVQGLWTLYEREEIGSDLVGYWKFDGNAEDSSSYGNDGTFNGETFNDGTRGSTPGEDGNDPTWVVTGKYGKALEFDGVDDYIEVSHDDTLAGFTDAFTATFWIKFDVVSDRQAILNKYNSAGSQRGWFIEYDPSNGIGFFASPDGSSYSHWYTPLSLEVSTWYHIAVVWESDIIPKFYINDGQPKTVLGTDTISQIYNNNLAPLHIGKSTYNTNRNVSGTIDEVRIFNQALTEEEIQAEMESSSPTIRPVASYSFEEGSGQSAYDTHIWVKGEYDSALSFDGVNDYIEVVNDDSLDMSTQLTIWAWIKSDAWSDWVTIVEKADRSKTPEEVNYWFSIDSSGYIRFWGKDSSGDWKYFLDDQNTVSTGSLHSVAVTYNNNIVTTFIDGAESDSGTMSLSPLLTTNGILSIGRGFCGASSPNCYEFNGTIDQVRVYNRALDEDEIKQLYLEKNSNSLEFTTFAKVSNIAISDPGTGIGWVALTPGGSCPPERGLVGFDPSYVVCAKGEQFSEGFNVIYRAWFRELYESTGTKGYRIDLIKHPSGHLSSSVGSVRISRGDVSSVVQDGKTLIITEIKILLV